jgi:hypothetical protein
MSTAKRTPMRTREMKPNRTGRRFRSRPRHQNRPAPITTESNQYRFDSSGSLVMLAAIRRASSRSSTAACCRNRRRRGQKPANPLLAPPSKSALSDCRRDSTPGGQYAGGDEQRVHEWPSLLVRSRCQYPTSRKNRRQLIASESQSRCFLAPPVVAQLGKHVHREARSRREQTQI